MMKQKQLPGGDRLERSRSAAVLYFAGRRRVLSSSPLNGGMRDDLRCVFNYDELRGDSGRCELRAPTYREHLAVVAGELGLDPDRATGLSTSAHIRNLAVRSESIGGCTVTALVTGGVDVNGGRVGDPAAWTEREGVPEPFSPGTVNILLHLSADLSPGGMATALMLCTEAKAAVLQELLCESCYSSSLATGTGTDGVVVIANPESELHLFHAGQHYKLGEVIGRTVHSALREALFLQTGLCPEQQHSALRRLKRYGISDVAPQLDQNPGVVAAASLCAHLLDQLEWGMLTPAGAAQAANAVLNSLEPLCGRKSVTIAPQEDARAVFDDIIREISSMIAS